MVEAPTFRSNISDSPTARVWQSLTAESAMRDDDPVCCLRHPNLTARHACAPRRRPERPVAPFGPLRPPPPRRLDPTDRARQSWLARRTTPPLGRHPGFEASGGRVGARLPYPLIWACNGRPVADPPTPLPLPPACARDLERESMHIRCTHTCTGPVRCSPGSRVTWRRSAPHAPDLPRVNLIPCRHGARTYSPTRRSWPSEPIRGQ